MSHKLLVGSVFTDDSLVQQHWLDLQLRFLEITTESFEHVAVLWKRQGNAFFERTTVIEPQTHYAASEAHIRGLTYLLYYFTERMEEFDHFLILDSDAFPIKQGWVLELIAAMEPKPVMDTDGTVLLETGHNYDLAMPIRAENLERRLHACVLFVKDRASLPKMTFDYVKVGNDLLGQPEEDVALTEGSSRQYSVYPLMRSNQCSVHPLACGVYYDMFYHHCCGSGREFNLRANQYWLSSIQATADMAQFTKSLMSDPSGFVSKLAGWSPERYAKFEVRTEQ